MLNIQNVVSTTYVGQKLNLKYIANRLINIEYKPSKFIAAIIRIQILMLRVLFFSLDD